MSDLKKSEASSVNQDARESMSSILSISDERLLVIEKHMKDPMRHRATPRNPLAESGFAPKTNPLEVSQSQDNLHSSNASGVNLASSHNQHEAFEIPDAFCQDENSIRSEEPVAEEEELLQESKNLSQDQPKCFV